jgi:hypothetical protein
MKLETGNAGRIDTAGTGWFVGFSDWARAGAPHLPDLRYMPAERRAHTLCMKWMAHPAGDPRGAVKPPSEGRTLSVLVSESGRFRLRFCENGRFDGEVVEHLLEHHGDFCIWGERIHHRYDVESPSTILTLRWIPEPIG